MTHTFNVGDKVLIEFEVVKVSAHSDIMHIQAVNHHVLGNAADLSVFAKPDAFYDIIPAPIHVAVGQKWRLKNDPMKFENDVIFVDPPGNDRRYVSVRYKGDMPCSYNVISFLKDWEYVSG